MNMHPWTIDIIWFPLRRNVMQQFKNASSLLQSLADSLHPHPHPHPKLENTSSSWVLIIIQLNSTLTDFIGLMNFILYRWNSVIVDPKNNRKKNNIYFSWNSVRSGSVEAGFNCANTYSFEGFRKLPRKKKTARMILMIMSKVLITIRLITCWRKK